MDKPKFSCTLDGNVKWYNHFVKFLAIFKKCCLSYKLVILLLGSYSKIREEIPSSIWPRRGPPLRIFCGLWLEWHVNTFLYFSLETFSKVYVSHWLLCQLFLFFVFFYEKTADDLVRIETCVDPLTLFRFSTMHSHMCYLFQIIQAFWTVIIITLLEIKKHMLRTKPQMKQIATENLLRITYWKVPTFALYIPIKDKAGTSLVLQWLRLLAVHAWGLNSISGQGAGPHMSQLKVLHAASETWCSRINE